MIVNSEARSVREQYKFDIKRHSPENVTDAQYNI